MPDFTKARGVDAMDRGKSGGGRLGQYWNYLRWTKDKETKYIQFLTPASELITLQMHEWIEVGTTKNGKPRYGFFLDRRDPCIGEDYDDITDRLDTPSKRRTIGVAVELEPQTSKVNGRNKVTGFGVKLESYTKTNDDGDTEEVEAPVIGLVSQAKANFYGWLGSYAESHEPIEETPFEIQRSGKNKDTTYVIVPFNNVEVDYTNLYTHLQNVGTLPPAVRDELSGDNFDPLEVGAKYLDLYLDEISDKERYDELVSGIDFIEDKFGNRTKKSSESIVNVLVDEEVEAEASTDDQIDKIDRLRKRLAKKE